MPMSPRLLRPRAIGGFSPRNISNLAGWWDFNDAATVTVSTGISSVLDKSGNGRTLAQTITNNRPTWTANAINGRYAAVFDGSNDSLTASFTLAQPITAFIVGKYDNATNVGTATMMDGTAGNSMRVFRTSSQQIALFAGVQLTSNNMAPESWMVIEAIFNGTSSSVASNSVTPVTGNAGTNTPNGIYFGVFGNGFSNPSAISIAHALLYSRSLAAAERSTVRKWLGTLYGITVA